MSVRFALAAASILACAAAQAQVPAMPSVEGPITGPGPVYPGLRPPTPGSEPADFGYVSEEYFVSGTANGQPYRTRIMVRKPEPAERFSGIVVVESLHSNGFAVTFEPARKSVLLRGHVQVDIAAQQGNLNTLRTFNPERYADVTMASGSQTVSEIIAQVGRLLKSNLSHGPLAPLAARRLVLQGTSQSSGVLRTYQSQQHFQARMPDGSSIYDGYLAVSTLGGAPMMVVDVPTVQMPTQTEVNSGAAGGNTYRRADSDLPENRFRLYETAGMPHANGRDTSPPECALPVSDFPWGAMVAMGLNHLVQWIDHGVVPPRVPVIEVDNDLGNDGSRLALDANGNAKGGVRNPYVDVPVAVYGVPNSGSGASAFLCSIAGWRIPFSEETLASMYTNKGGYISRLNRNLMQRVREGWMLPEYAEDVRAEALGIPIPNPSAK